MKITIKQKWNLSEEERKIVSLCQHEFSACFRFCYNRLLNYSNYSVYERTQMVQKLNKNFLYKNEIVDAHLKQSALKEASTFLAMQTTDQEKQIYSEQKKADKLNISYTRPHLKVKYSKFGRKENWEKYEKKLDLFKENKISKSDYDIAYSEFKSNRLMACTYTGEKGVGGNRKGEFYKIDDEYYLKLKIDIRNHIVVKLDNFNNNWKEHLDNLFDKTQSHATTYVIRFDCDEISITFDKVEKVKSSDIVKDSSKFAGLDLNPRYVGLAIIDKNNEKNKFTMTYDLSKLLMRTKGYASDSEVEKKRRNKLRHETIHIAIDIVNKLVNNKVSTLACERLDFTNSDPFLSKTLNRECRNEWLKKLFITKLQNLCEERGIKFIFVAAQYSSQMGNIAYDDFDPNCSALEIARRGMVSTEKNVWKLLDYVQTHGLQTNEIKSRVRKLGLSGCSDWWGIFGVIKKSGMRYRRYQSDFLNHKIYRFKSDRSKVNKLTQFT